MQRVGISMSEQELRRVSHLQKRLGVRSRSELFRELVRRYEELESARNALQSCVSGYLEHPESENQKSRAAVLKAAVKNQPFEDWS